MPNENYGVSVRYGATVAAPCAGHRARLPLPLGTRRCATILSKLWRPHHVFHGHVVI